MEDVATALVAAAAAAACWALRIACISSNAFASVITFRFLSNRALFVRRRAFGALDGFRAIEIMEDVDFVRRLRRLGRLTLLRSSVRTSARRWIANGVVRTTLVNWAAFVLFLCRASPARIRRYYDGALASRERPARLRSAASPAAPKEDENHGFCESSGIEYK